MRVLCLLGLAGCGAMAPDASGPICRPGDPAIDGAMFARLTANRWGTCSSSGLCLELRGDGTYHTREGFDDYSVEDNGAWNFVAHNDKRGQVCLDDGSVVQIAFTPNGLEWELRGALSPTEPLAIGGTRDDLPELVAPPLWGALTAHPWAKTNDFDLYAQPTAMTLNRDGSFAASFRGGACSATGHFSLVKVGAMMELHPRAEPNDCDTRGGGTPANIGSSNDWPSVEGGILRLYSATYRDATIATDERSLAFNAYGGADPVGITVGASWTVDQPSMWRLQLHNATPRAATLTTLRITLTPLAVEADGYSYAGAESVLVDRVLSASLPALGVHETTADVPLPTTGIYQLTVNAGSFDERQSYANRRDFLFSGEAGRLLAR